MTDYKVADLDKEKLRRILELEKELGIVLIAYNKTAPAVEYGGTSRKQR